MVIIIQHALRTAGYHSWRKYWALPRRLEGHIKLTSQGSSKWTLVKHPKPIFKPSSIWVLIQIMLPSILGAVIIFRTPKGTIILATTRRLSYASLLV